MRAIAPTLLILAGTAICLSAVETPAEPVRIKDFAVTPMGNLGSADGATTFNLKGLVGVGYDSNIFATETDEAADSYLRVAAGFEVKHRVGESLTFALDALLNNETYVDYSERNLLGGKGIGSVKYEGESARASLEVDYERYDDPLVQTGEQIQRETYGGLAKLGWEGAATKGGLTLDAHQTMYLEDAGGFIAEDRNVLTSKLGFVFALISGENSETWARVSAGTDTYETNNRLQDDTMVGGYLGCKLPLGERAKLLAEIGVLSRAFSDEFLPGYDDEDVVLPEGSLVLAWPWNDEGSELVVRGYVESRTSLTSNAMSVSGLSANVRVRATEQFVVLAGLEGVMVADTASAPGADAEERSTVIGTAGVEYHAMDGFAVRLVGRQTSSEAEVDTSNDYVRSEVALEAAVVF